MCPGGFVQGSVADVVPVSGIKDMCWLMQFMFNLLAKHRPIHCWKTFGMSKLREESALMLRCRWLLLLLISLGRDGLLNENLS